MSRHTDPTPVSYSQAADILASGRDKDSRKISNNTWLERRGRNAIAVRLHRADVVTFHANGLVEFNTDGWNTSTTRERLNRYAPAGVRFGTKRGELLVTTPAGSFPFVDGVAVDQHGRFA